MNFHSIPPDPRLATLWRLLVNADTAGTYVVVIAALLLGYAIGSC